MLLMLKHFLKKAYSISDERVTAFSSDISDKRKQASCTENACSRSKMCIIAPPNVACIVASVCTFGGSVAMYNEVQGVSLT